MTPSGNPQREQKRISPEACCWPQCGQYILKISLFSSDELIESRAVPVFDKCVIIIFGWKTAAQGSEKTKGRIHRKHPRITKAEGLKVMWDAKRQTIWLTTGLVLVTFVVYREAHDEARRLRRELFILLEMIFLIVIIVMFYIYSRKK